MRILVAGLILLAFGLLSCKETFIINGLNGGTLTAEINGVHFEATSVMAVRKFGSSGIGDGFTISGSSSSGFPSLTLNLFSTTKGQYNLGVAGTGNTNAVYGSSPGEEQISNWGTITVDLLEYEEGGIVKGTFVFLAASDSITHGTFQVPFSN